ncbi:hypothetical protein N7455_009745 [Penicillium solitum]|uniref:uncharacterized protein n=1 Tax=Penicillium solitum TaxID=60172 RepID=UPI0032C4AAA0|nr:hypothetical protein N7455_009745 [Penicillium solitum]
MPFSYRMLDLDSKSDGGERKKLGKRWSILDKEVAGQFVKESPDYWWVKIGDFGISKRVSDGQAYLRTPIGTHGFIPPEILENDGSDLQYTAKVDMWSLGVLIHYMITNTLPFDDKRKLRQYIRTSHFPWTKLASYSVSKECHDFVTKGLLGTTAASRLSASDALQHQCLIDTCTSAPNKDAIEASDTQYVPVAETEPTNDQGRGKDSTAGSVLPELTDASASWSAQIGEESQISIRTKYEVAQGLQEVQGKTTAIQQSIFTKDVLVSDLSNDLRIFHDEGLSLLGQQQHSGAKIMLEEALNLRQNALGTYHEDTMASLSALGDVLCVQKKYTEAEATYRDTFYHQEKYTQAEATYRDVWVRRCQALGTKHAETLACLDRLGDALFNQAMLPEAELVYRDAWDLRKQTLGKGHEDTLWSLHWLVQSLCSQEKHDEAEALYRDAWEGCKQILGQDHKHTLLALHWLDQTVALKTKYTPAEVTYPGVWEEGRKQTLGKDYTERLTSLDISGGTLFGQNEYAQAKPKFREAWEIRKKTLGKNQEDTLNSLESLANSLYRRRKYALAEVTYRDVWEGRKRALWQNHPATLASLYWIGNALFSQDKYALAETVYRDVWEGRKETLGADHQETLWTLHNLAFTLFCQEKYALAEIAYRDVWEGRKQTLGKDHEDTHQSLYSLGRALHCQEKYALAEITYRDAWEGRKRVLGGKHADTIESLHQLEQT